MSKTKLISSLVFCIFLLASWMYGENQERIIIQTPLKPIKEVYPDYPEILKKEGVAARFLISISIDTEPAFGTVFILNWKKHSKRYSRSGSLSHSSTEGSQYVPLDSYGLFFTQENRALKPGKANP